MRWFRKMYVWAMNAKLFMALYFIVMVFALGIVVLLSGGDSVRLLTLLEMLLVCAVIAALQALWLSDGTDYSHGVFFGRSVLWIGVSTGLALGCALVFGWFAGYAAWSFAVFAALMLLTLPLTLVGIKFEQEADTIRLNGELKRFQNRP